MDIRPVLPLFGLYNSAAALFRSMEKTKITMYVSLLMNVINVAGNAIGIFVFRLGSAWLFGIALQMGIIGVWIAMGTDWLCRSVFFLLRFKSGKWQEHRAI